jgi:hypothetical protein
MSGFLRIYVLKKRLKSAQITQFFLLTDGRYKNADYHTEITYCGGGINNTTEQKGGQ